MTKFIVLISLAGIALGKIPALKMNRATTTVSGTTVPILTRAVTP